MTDEAAEHWGGARDPGERQIVGRGPPDGQGDGKNELTYSPADLKYPAFVLKCLDKRAPAGHLYAPRSRARPLIRLLFFPFRFPAVPMPLRLPASLRPTPDPGPSRRWLWLGLLTGLLALVLAGLALGQPARPAPAAPGPFPAGRAAATPAEPTAC